MECREVQEALEEFRQETLPERETTGIRAHLAACPRCQAVHEEAQALARILWSRLPRYPAPPALRGRVLQAAGRGRRRLALLSNPWVSAGVAAGVTLLLLVPFLTRGRGPDAMRALAAEARSEHLRSVLTEEIGEGQDYEALVRRLRVKTGVALRWFFPGDPEVKLVDARPALVMGKTGVGLVYQDRAGRAATYLVFPGPEVAVPATGRVQVEDFRPYWGQADGYAFLFWKWDGLNCLLVSDWDRERFLNLFLKVRRSADRPPDL